MATATSSDTRASKLDDTAEAVGSRFAAAAAPAARALGKHLTHVAVFLVFVVARERFALPIAAHMQAGFGDGLGGIPAVLLHTWAVSFDAVWTFILGLASGAQGGVL